MYSRFDFAFFPIPALYAQNITIFSYLYNENLQEKKIRVRSMKYRTAMAASLHFQNAHDISTIGLHSSQSVRHTLIHVVTT